MKHFKKLMMASLFFSCSSFAAPPAQQVLLPTNPPVVKPASATATTATTANNSTTDSDDILMNLIDQENPDTTPPVSDPYSKYNHVMFNFNDALDKGIAKPVAEFYIRYMPAPLYTMAINFYQNIDTLTTFYNDIFQANFYQATSDGWRLLINSTVGVAGFFDVARHMGLEPNYTDFGITLGKWGWANSSYFIIPILGPSTIRDAGGRFVNYEISVYPMIHNFWVRNGIYAFSLLNERAEFLKYQGVADQAAIDPYVFMRDAFIQRRNYQIQRDKNLNDPYTPKEMKKYYNPYYLYGRSS